MSNNDEQSAKEMKMESELEQVQESFFWEFTGMVVRFVDWLHKYERIETLTRNQAEFLNEIAIARQKYLDGEDQIRIQEKINGKLGQ